MDVFLAGLDTWLTSQAIATAIHFFNQMGPLGKKKKSKGGSMQFLGHVGGIAGSQLTRHAIPAFWMYS